MRVMDRNEIEAYLRAKQRGQYPIIFSEHNGFIIWLYCLLDTILIDGGRTKTLRAIPSGQDIDISDHLKLDRAGSQPNNK